MTKIRNPSTRRIKLKCICLRTKSQSSRLRSVSETNCEEEFSTLNQQALDWYVRMKGSYAKLMLAEYNLTLTLGERVFIHTTMPAALDDRNFEMRPKLEALDKPHPFRYFSR